MQFCALRLSRFAWQRVQLIQNDLGDLGDAFFERRFLLGHGGVSSDLTIAASARLGKVQTSTRRKRNFCENARMDGSRHSDGGMLFSGLGPCLFHTVTR
jgi:hypothetical protein